MVDGKGWGREKGMKSRDGREGKLGEMEENELKGQKAEEGKKGNVGKEKYSVYAPNLESYIAPCICQLTLVQRRVSLCLVG